MLTLLLTSILLVAPAEVEARTLDGRLIAGSLVELDAEHLTVKTADGNESVDISGLMEVATKNESPAPQTPPSVWIELVDGSSLVGSAYTAAGGKGKLVAAGVEVEVPVADIKAVRLQDQDEAMAAEWREILDKDTDSDLLVTRKGDSIDYHEGVLRDVTDKVVNFDLDGDILPIKLSKVHGLVHHHPAGRKLSEAICTLTDQAGSQWIVSTLKLGGSELQWTTRAGLEVARPLDAVERIDFSRGKIVHLGDLEPESALWTPYFGTKKKLPSMESFYAPRRNRGLEPDGLRLGGKQYQKGLALHGHTKMVYRLPEGFRRLKATVGMDDRVRPRGNARLVVSGDERVLLETTVTGTDPPKEVDLDITGVRRLSILVDFGEDLGVADHLDLCEARIVK